MLISGTSDPGASLSEEHESMASVGHCLLSATSTTSYTMAKAIRLSLLA